MELIVKIETLDLPDWADGREDAMNVIKGVLQAHFDATFTVEEVPKSSIVYPEPRRMD